MAETSLPGSGIRPYTLILSRPCAALFCMSRISPETVFHQGGLAAAVEPRTATILRADLEIKGVDSQGILVIDLRSLTSSILRRCVINPLIRSSPGFRRRDSFGRGFLPR